MLKRIRLTIVAVLALGGFILASCTGELAMTPALATAGTATHGSAAPSLPKWMTRPCAEEDSVNCYWDAQTMGNGKGHSFYVRKLPGDITGLACIFYVKPRDARRWDHCYPVSR